MICDLCREAMGMPKMDWINIEDKLPEDEEEWVLTYEPLYGVQFCSLNSAIWRNTRPGFWMQAPEPPKEESC
jgi:hypothetical protein